MDNKKDKKMLIFIGIFLLIVIVLIFYRGNYKLDLELVDSEIKVNIYDKINLKEYIVKAMGNDRNLKYNVKIKVEKDKLDKLEDNVLTINSYGEKKIDYTITFFGKKLTKSIIIDVIIDPNDEEYIPNYEYEEKDVNTDDNPTQANEESLNEEEKKYINSFLN